MNFLPVPVASCGRGYRPPHRKQTAATGQLWHRPSAFFFLFSTQDVFFLCSVVARGVSAVAVACLPSGDKLTLLRISDKCQRDAGGGRARRRRRRLMCCSSESQVTAGWHTLWFTDTIQSHGAAASWIIYSVCFTGSSSKHKRPGGDL